MKVTFDSVMYVARIIACISLAILMAMYFFTESKIRTEQLIVVSALTIASFLPYILKK